MEPDASHPRGGSAIWHPAFVRIRQKRDEATLRRNSIRFSAALAAAAALSLGLAACGGGGGGGTGGGSGAVTLGFIGAQTGDNAQLGINIYNGAKLAVDEYNASKPKTKVTLKAYDTAGDPAIAPSQVNKAIQDKIVGVIGLPFSGESQAVQPTLEKAEIPNISPSATDPTLGKKGFKFFHRLVANDDAQGAADAKMMTNTYKAKKVFVVDDNQQYSLGIANIVFNTLKGGGTQVQRDKIDPKASDYSSTVNKIKAFSPDAIFYGGYYAEGGKLLKQLRDAGVTAKFQSDDGADDPNIIKTAGAKQAEGITLSCACQSVATSTDPKVKKFIDDYKAKFNVGQGTYSAEGYDATNAFLDAIKAGNTTSTKINDFLKTINVPGISKQIQFNPQGEVTANTIYQFQVLKGNLEFLGPTDKVKLGKPE